MRLPPPSSSYTTFVRYGLYVVRRLRRAGLTDLATSVERGTLAARESGRAWEDADDAIQAALADRDAADDELDLTAQSARATLAGRGISADREAPYTLIFPAGIGYYIAASLDENAKRYGELRARLEQNLPASDAVRKSAVPALQKGVKDFEAAVKSLDAAESAERIAGTRARTALRTLERQLEKTYGALVADLGKSRAESFFPRTRGSRRADPSAPPAPPTP